MDRKGNATSSTSQELSHLLAALKAANSLSDLVEAVQAISEHASSLSLHINKGAHTQQAKELAPFYIEVIKEAFIRLSASQEAELLSTSLQLAQLALEGLHAARHVLKGRAYEVEVQRYALVRRLVSLKAFPEALEQGWVLFDSLCQLWPVADDTSKKRGNNRSLKAEKASKQVGQENPNPSKLPLQLGGPTGAEDSAAQAANIVVGTVLNLALCTAEGCSTDSVAQHLERLLSTLEQLAPWLKLLPKEEAQKHNDTLFRCLYKAALLVLDNCSGSHLAIGICQALATACIASSIPFRLSNVLVKLEKYLPASEVSSLLAWCLAQLKDDAQSTGVALAAIDSFASQCTEAHDFQLAATLITEAATRQSASVEWRLLGLYATAMHLRSSKTVPTCTWLPALRAAEQALASLSEQLQQSTAVADELKSLLPTVFKAITFLRKSSAPPASDQPASWQLAKDEAAASGADCISNVLCSLAMLLRAASRAGGVGDGSSMLAKYSYPAISGLVAAAQIRCFSALGSKHCQATPVCDDDGFGFFWEQPDASEDGHEWRALLQLRGPELHWVSSVMHSVGTALCSANMHSQAATPLRVAAQAAAVCAALARDSASAAQPLRDAVGSCEALVSCHLLNEDRNAAIKDVQGAIMLWHTYGIPAQQWRPLLRLLICSWFPSREPHMLSVNAKAHTAAHCSAETAAAEFVCLLDLAVPPAALASMLQEAVLALHSAVDDGSLQDSTGHAACQALLAKLLHEVCPVESDARGHAGTLLLQAAVSQGVNNDARIALIEAAVAILDDALPDCEEEEAEAAYECGAGHALLALELASAARGSRPQGDSHAMVEPSKSAADVDGLASRRSGTGDRGAELQPAEVSKWQSVRKHALQALHVWQKAPGSICLTRCKLAPSSPWLVRELAALAGVQGRWDDQRQACQTAAKLADAFGLASKPPESCRCPVSQTLIPAALREDVRSLHGDLQREHASLWRQEADRLAREGGGDAAACLKRALLHQCLASLSMQSGSLAVALFDASEALRISGSACERTQAPHNACLRAYGGETAELVGWWQASSMYLACLLQIGELHELLGAPDDAIRAFKEGKELAIAQDAMVFLVMFDSRLAEVRGRLGAWAEAEDHLAAAQCALNLGQDASPDSLAFMAMELSRVAGGIARRQGDVQRALGLYQQASRSLANAPIEGDLAWAITRLSAQVCLAESKCQLQLGHAQKAAGLAREAQQCLEDFSDDGREHPMQKAAVVLFLAEQATHLALECTAAAEVEVWGIQKPADGKAKANPKGGRGRGRGKVANKAQSAPSKPALQEQLQPLLWALEVSQHAPQLLRRVSHTLALVCASLSCPSAAAYFLQASLGASMRVQCEAGVQAQLLIAQRQARPTMDTGALRAKHAASNTLRVWPDGEQARDKINASNIEAQAQDRLQELLSSLPERSVICSISSWYGTAPSGEGGFSLLISRCAPGRQPLTIRLTLPAEALEVSGEAACGASPLEVFGSILHDSAASMDSDVAEESVAQRRQWWRKRVALDLRMAALLAHLDQKWLGPWRCLLWGCAPELEASGCIEAAVQSLLGELVSRKGGTDVSAPQLLGELVELIMLGVPAISTAELHAAVVHICRIADVPADDAQAAGLADLFRARYKDVVRSAQVQPGTIDPDLASERSPVPLLDISNAGARGDTLRRCRPEVVSLPVLESRPPQALQADAGDTAPRPIRAKRPKATAGKLAAAAEAEQPIAQSARKLANRKLFNIPESPAPSGRALRDRDLATPAAKAGTARAAMSARSTRSGLMARMQAAAEGCDRILGPTPRHVPSRASRMSKTTNGPAIRGMDVDGPRTARRVSDTDSDGGGSSKEDDDAFVLHRGAATELGELASRMRGLALEQAAGAQQVVGAEERSDEVMAPVDREAVVLVLDAQLQVLPWESLTGLKDQRMYRMPSLAGACYLSEQRALRGQLGTHEAGVPRAQHTAVDVSSTLYMLNPSGDLPATQAAFEVLFAGQQTWKGTVGEPMAAQELVAGLQAHDLFLYCGHGAGEQYIPQRLLRRLPSCAAALLMGCSSGSLMRKGCYEATGPILAYLEAGCPAAVANLWDVTDRDIDRFCRAVLDGWLVPSQSSQVDEKAACGCLSKTVAANRLACRLPHLIGAAPVCYGLPTVVRKVESNQSV